MSVELLQRLNVFPVRHHSPRASAVLRALLDRLRPQLVLVEGPSDATALIAPLVDEGTRPPVAIMGYRTDGQPGSSLWPFATYSPEYVALAWAHAAGAHAELIDITIGQSLAHQDLPPPEEEDRQGSGDEESASADDDGDDDGEEDFFASCARALGHRSFDELWEAAFEAPAYDVEQFRAAVLAYAELVRARGERDFHRAREAAMTRRIGECLTAAGVAPERCVVVVGAAHAAAFLAGDVDPALESTLPAAVPCTATLIPFSFPRLAEQLGYGAGNRAPRYYQRAHDAGCDFRRATLEVLIELAEALRLRGFAASLADTIEAYRLAVMLAALRGKAAPGLDEVREATIATMGRGDRGPVDAFLWPSVIGHSIGKVAASVARSSLQEEFWREVKARKLPDTDSAEQFVLKLNNDVEIGTSIFLHRLRVAGVPYASFMGTRGSTAGAAEQAGGYAALSRMREGWEAQWTPATDVALVEKIVLGDCLERVATRALREALATATTTGTVADVLLESVVVACPEITGEALLACDRLAAGDDDLPSLARAAHALSALVAYGSSRTHLPAGAESIGPLCVKTFDRAVLRVPDACQGDDEATAPVKDAMRTLHELALAQPLCDKQAWLDAAGGLVRNYAINASCAGLACGLLYLAGVLREEEIAAIVGQRLSDGLEPERAAAFLEGFLEVNATVLVKSRPVVQALDAFLCAIPADRFKDVLPILRRALGPLGQTERRYLLENIVAVRNLHGSTGAVQAIITERDKEKLKEANTAVAQALDDLDDLL